MMKNKDSFLNNVLLATAGIMVSLSLLTVIKNFGLMSVPTGISFILTAITFFMIQMFWKK